jgi:anti-anti-sigma factor
VLGTCKAVGEIDLATVPGLTADMQNSIDDSHEELVCVACSGVTFTDSSGFHAFVDATEYAARRGRRLVIREMSPWCRSVIRLCDWDRELRFERLAAPDGPRG